MEFTFPTNINRSGTIKKKVKKLQKQGINIEIRNNQVRMDRADKDVQKFFEGQIKKYEISLRHEQMRNNIQPASMMIAPPQMSNQYPPWAQPGMQMNYVQGRSYAHSMSGSQFEESQNGSQYGGSQFSNSPQHTPQQPNNNHSRHQSGGLIDMVKGKDLDHSRIYNDMRLENIEKIRDDYRRTSGLLGYTKVRGAVVSIPQKQQSSSSVAGNKNHRQSLIHDPRRSFVHLSDDEPSSPSSISSDSLLKSPPSKMQPNRHTMTFDPNQIKQQILRMEQQSKPKLHNNLKKPRSAILSYYASDSDEDVQQKIIKKQQTSKGKSKSGMPKSPPPLIKLSPGKVKQIDYSINPSIKSKGSTKDERKRKRKQEKKKAKQLEDQRAKEEELLQIEAKRIKEAKELEELQELKKSPPLLVQMDSDLNMSERPIHKSSSNIHIVKNNQNIVPVAQKPKNIKSLPSSISQLADGSERKANESSISSIYASNSVDVPVHVPKKSNGPSSEATNSVNNASAATIADHMDILSSEVFNSSVDYASTLFTPPSVCDTNVLLDVDMSRVSSDQNQSYAVTREGLSRDQKMLDVLNKDNAQLKNVNAELIDIQQHVHDAFVNASPDMLEEVVPIVEIMTSPIQIDMDADKDYYANKPEYPERPQLGDTLYRGGASRNIGTGIDSRDGRATDLDSRLENSARNVDISKVINSSASNDEEMVLGCIRPKKTRVKNEPLLEFKGEEKYSFMPYIPNAGMSYVEKPKENKLKKWWSKLIK
eukprot:NODE_339_length_10647_cov_0.388320.p1 type:complete len:761 gc:universal NODE_339_length_10647_cov_0.388320:946-3228(+)